MSLPRVVIVGRPNVGKSSLLNRLIGRRVSIVEPTAGVTRDRVSADLKWGDRRFELVDTGGLGLVDEVLLRDHIETQIEVALHDCCLVLFLVDGKEGLVPSDQMVADRLRRLNKPVVLVANKVESRWDEFSVHEWARIGFGDALAVSAVEGFGMSVLMDRIVDMLPEKSEAEELDHDETLRFSIVGKRNSGKSTLVNQLVGEDRVIVSEIPGTTRDAVDVAFEYENCKMIAIDTAGVRKKRSIQDAIEYYSYSRAVESIRRSSVVMHLFDITADISQVDKKLAAFCVENYRPSILVGNKVDLADDLELGRWDGYIRQQLKGLWYAPVIFASALDATNLSETLSIILDLRAQARTQIPTARLNEVLQEARNKLQPRNRGLIPKMFYATQVGTEPLTILIFVNEPRLFRGQYDRYLQNRLREVFDCREVPIKLLFRRREKVALDPLG